MTFVLGVSSLAFLARSGHLETFASVPDDLLVAERAHDLLVADAPTKPDANALARVGELDALRVVSASDADLYRRLRRNDRIADADAATVALAALVGGVVVSEEPYLQRIAVSETVPAATLPGVLLAAVNGGLPAPRALDAFEDLMAAGWHVRPDLYAGFIRTLDSRV